MNSFLTVETRCEHAFTVNRSEFIATLIPVKSAEDGETVLEEIRKKHPSATHHCYAYILSPFSNAFRFSDDGEPSGTAGMPILNVLKKNNLYEVMVVVTRYFGGIKLGAGGLVAAYTRAAAECVKEAHIVEKQWSAILEATFSYSTYKTFMSKIQGIKNTILDTLYDQNVTVTFAVPAELETTAAGAVTEASAGTSSISNKESKYIIYER